METVRQVRRLAAILMADVVGYSRLMAADENAALAALNQHREAEFDPVVARHSGRVVKLMGDGALVEFASVVDAVDCALAIQTAAAQGQPTMVLRIGINLGDIILQGEDVYGDGVNIAARLEPLAAPGGICVSSVVHEIIRDRGGTAFADGGEVEVKNIARPVKIWRWHPSDGAGAAPALSAAVRRSEGPTIAVLAFDNMSGDPEQAYFSDGIAEDIITDLSKVAGLTVIARNSSFAYKGRAVDLRAVGRELGVSHVLEGSVRRAGNRVRVTAQLIDAATGTHLWADRYDGDLADVFAVQDEVTLKIVEALKVRLTPTERAAIERVGTSDPAAHDAYLRMRDLVFSPVVNAESWAQAMGHGNHAIKLDPDYAQALGLMAMAHAMGAINGWSAEEADVVAARATALAERAVSSSPEEPLANIAFASTSRIRGDFEAAVKAGRKAVSLSPDSGHALSNLAANLIATGSSAEAVPLLERAIRLDPGWSQQYMQFLGQAHFLQRNFQTAALLFRERLYLARDTDIGRGWLAATLGHLGEIGEARAIWAELIAIKPDFRMASRLILFRYQRPEDPALVLEGLEKAGLPTGA